LLHLKKQDIILNKTLDIENFTKQKLAEAVLRLLQHEPIQYILGESHFYGLKLKVTNAVLIPRPETEELVDWIIKTHQNKENLTILDIGTGSGCIPIALAKHLKNAIVYAIDVSPDALRVAQENAEMSKVNVNFERLDILEISEINPLSFGGVKFDVMVSNPPYISIEEKEQMQKNVLDYEPPLALFVNDKNPLLFYEKIIFLAKGSLNEGGSLYFEINESFGKEVKDMLGHKHFEQIELIKDLQGKDRMVRGSLAKK
jgi:release factor glutamine methyltransferase